MTDKLITLLSDENWREFAAKAEARAALIASYAHIALKPCPFCGSGDIHLWERPEFCDVAPGGMTPATSSVTVLAEVARSAGFQPAE